MPRFCQRPWFKITVLYGAWLGLILLLAVIFTRGQILPFTPSYPYVETLVQSNLPPWLWRFGGFDGVHYLTLVETGYLGGVGGVQAFFPLYPLLVRGLTFGVFPPLGVGLFLSVICTWGFLQVSFLVVSQLFKPRVAWWWLLVILFSPVSFFLISFYTESLFLLLVFAAIWAYQKKRFGWVALFGILLSATRVIGICLPFCLACDYLYQTRRQLGQRVFHAWRELFLIASGAGGLLLYGLFLWLNFADPLYFFHVQADFNWGRQTELVLLPQVFWRYGKIIWTYGQTLAGGLSLNYFQAWASIQELGAALLGIGGLALTAWWNYRRPRPLCPWYWWGFSALALFLPPLTGTLVSMPRYLLAVLVVFLFLAWFFARRAKIGVLLLCLSGGIMALNLLLFLQGFWVA